MKIDDIKIGINSVKKNLNPKLWEENKTLKKEIRKKMLEISDGFIDFLKTETTVKDILFTGSMANYNWTEISDVDIHVILDFGKKEEDFIEEFLDAKNSLWKLSHNITLKGYDVEIYAKNSEENILKDKSVFSLKNNKWLIEPSKERPEINFISIKNKVNQITKDIKKIEKLKNIYNKEKKANVLWKKIKKYRKAGLDSGGEYSTENLVFKTLRRNGCLGKLKDIKVQTFDSKLTLKESHILFEYDEEKNKTDYGCLMLNLDIPGWEKLKNSIDSGDLYERGGYGFENNPHVTVLYGLYNDKLPEDLKQYIEKIGPAEVVLKDISCFENKDFDVVKISVDSDKLHHLNSVISQLPNANQFEEYDPHITVAYVKPGFGKKYNRDLKNAISISSNKFVYSAPNRKKEVIQEMETKETKRPDITLGIEEGIEMSPEKLDIIKKFINFTINKLNIQEPVKIYLHKGRDEYIATTASYDPSENSNHVRVGGRALVDDCRSIGHELTHNRQRELKKFNLGDVVQNIGGELENEANAIAGILIKDFAINYGNDEIYEY